MHPFAVTVVAALVLVVVVLAGIAITIAVHELAHALAALSVRAASVRVRWGTRSRALGAHVEAELPDVRWARAWFFAAGPLANVALAAACWSAEGPFVRGLGLVSALFALVCTFGSDGRGVVRSIWSTSPATTRNDDARAVR